MFDKGKACEKMFNKISTVAYDSTCLNDGEQDFIRRVPCDKGELCPDEDNPNNVLPKAQLTYRIQDLVQSRYYCNSTLIEGTIAIELFLLIIL